jgi:hypothetical protein
VGNTYRRNQHRRILPEVNEIVVVFQIECVAPLKAAVHDLDEVIDLFLVESTFECNLRELEVSTRLKWLPRYVIQCGDQRWWVGNVVRAIVFESADLRRFTASLMIFCPYVVLSRVFSRVSGACPSRKCR